MAEEKGRFGRTILLEGARGCFLAADASYVFGNVVFGIEIGCGSADACDCARYGYWQASLAEVRGIGGVEVGMTSAPRCYTSWEHAPIGRAMMIRYLLY